MAEEILVLMADLDDESQKIMGKITRLHLCAFWPTREIAAVYLKDKQEDTI